MALPKLAPPLPIPLVVTPHGAFGEPRPNRNGIHRGIDFAAPRGTPVLSALPGIVARTGFDKPVAEGGGGGGMFVIVQSLGFDPDAPENPEALMNHFYETGYMHLDRIDVDKGAGIQAGQQLGQVGSSGTKDGAVHLHFELRHVKGPNTPVERRTFDPAPLFGLPPKKPRGGAGGLVALAVIGYALKKWLFS